MQEQNQVTQKPFLYLTPSQAKEKFGVKEVYGAVIGKPTINKLQIVEMMANYRKFTASYNDDLKRRNQKIQDYNVAVHVHVEQCNLHNAQETEQDLFDFLYGHMSIIDYNKKVDEYRAETSTNILLKRLHKKVRHALQDTFIAIIYKYASDLAKDNHRREKYGLTVKRPLDALKVASTNFSLQDENGVKRLDLSPRTIKNHLRRFKDAGILFGYSYHGPLKPVEYHVNPKILVVFDQKKKETLNTENQLFIISLGKVFPDRRVDTSTNSSKKEIKTYVDNSTEVKEGNLQIANHLNTFFKRNNLVPVHPPGSSEKEKFGPAKNPLSEQLQQSIEDSTEFAYKLRTNQFSTYEPITEQKLFEKEAESSTCTLLKSEFRQVLLQSALKYASRWWQNDKIWVWPQTIELFNDEYFKNPNGTIPSKTVLLYQYKNFLLRAKWVSKQVKKGWQCQPPITYFDPTRTQASEAGFGYSVKILKQLEKKQKQAQNRKDKRLTAALSRRKNNKTQEKVIKAVGRYKNGHINYTQLVNYIVNNDTIPNYHLEHLSKYIEYAYSKKY